MMGDMSEDDARFIHKLCERLTEAVYDLRDVHSPLFTETVDRLLHENTLPLPPGSTSQTDAMECQVFFKSGYKAQGVLSKTPEGTLRLMSRATTGPGGTGDPIMVEQFFSISTVESVLLLRRPEELLARMGSGLIIPRG